MPKMPEMSEMRDTPAGRRGTLPDIRHTVLLQAPIDKVWQAVATREGLAAWFMPNDLQPEPGRPFTLQTPFGTSRCRVTEADPPRRLAFTWGDDWHVTFELEALGDKTRLTLVHGGWIAGKVAPETGETCDVIRDRMDQGWGSTVLPRLRRVVEA